MVAFSWRGIPVVLHPTFLLMLGLWLLWNLSQSGLTGVVVAALGAFLIFGSVLLHELGHAVAAARFGIRAHAIVLHPFGGATLFDRRRMTPARDLVVSLAGPMANLALAAAGGVVWMLTGWALAWMFTGLHLVLAIFNLLPAYPTDGGRAFRVVAERVMGAARGARFALAVGAGLSLAALAYAVRFGDISLGLVAGLLLMEQWRERGRLNAAPAPSWG